MEHDPPVHPARTHLIAALVAVLVFVAALWVSLWWREDWTVRTPEPPAPIPEGPLATEWPVVQPVPDVATPLVTPDTARCDAARTDAAVLLGQRLDACADAFRARGCLVPPTYAELPAGLLDSLEQMESMLAERCPELLEQPVAHDCSEVPCLSIAHERNQAISERCFPSHERMDPSVAGREALGDGWYVTPAEATYDPATGALVHTDPRRAKLYEQRVRRLRALVEREGGVEPLMQRRMNVGRAQQFVCAEDGAVWPPLPEDCDALAVSMGCEEPLVPSEVASAHVAAAQDELDDWQRSCPDLLQLDHVLDCDLLPCTLLVEVPEELRRDASGRPVMGGAVADALCDRAGPSHQERPLRLVGALTSESRQSWASIPLWDQGLLDAGGDALLHRAEADRPIRNAAARAHFTARPRTPQTSAPPQLDPAPAVQP